MAVTSEQAAESAPTEPIFQWWKYGMLVLAFFGSLLRGGTVESSWAAASGFALGQTLAIAIGLAVFTTIYRRAGWSFLSLLSTRVYAAICLFVAFIGALGIFVQGNGGAFILAYFILLGPVLLVEKIRS